VKWREVARGVGLAGAGAGQDQAVVIVQAPPVPPDDPAGGRVGADQDAAVRVGSVGQRRRKVPLARGKAKARASVSITRVCRSPSCPSGRVEVHAASCRQVAGWVSSIADAAAARTCAVASCSSSRVGAWTVRYTPTRKSRTSPGASA
jgi:hypothetical protein